MPKKKGLTLLKTLQISEKEIKQVTFMPGDVIDKRYRVEKLLGAGGMGAVYLVKDEKLANDLKALKVMLPKLVESGDAQERFRNEIRISQKLTHGNILRVFEFDEDEEKAVLFFTMEYLAGSNMRDWLVERRKKGVVALAEVVRVIEQVLEGLALAHDHTVHRDIKPENILIGESVQGEVVKVCDFGLAQLYGQNEKMKTSNVMGTISYMAPEQMHGGEIDHRADLYSVGVIFYEALTGNLPLGRFELPGEMRKDLPGEVDEVVERALKFAAEKRFESAKEMQAAMQRLVMIPTEEKEEATSPEEELVVNVEQEQEEPEVSLAEDLQQQELAKWREKIVPEEIARFVEQSKGVWSYQEYQEFLREQQQKFPELETVILAQLLEEEKQRYAQSKKDSGTSESIHKQLEDNLKHLQVSGLVGEFVRKHEGEWQEEDWQEFLEYLQEQGFYPIREREVEKLVGEAQEKYFVLQKEVEEKKEDVKALEKGYQYERALALLGEIRASEYWDKVLEETHKRIEEKIARFNKSVSQAKELLEQQEYRQARESLKRARKLKPRNTEVKLLWQEVEEKIQQQEEKRKREEEVAAALVKGDKLYQENKFKEAIGSWKQAWGINEDEAVGKRIEKAKEAQEELSRLVERFRELKSKEELAEKDIKEAEKLEKRLSSKFAKSEEVEGITGWLEEMRGKHREQELERKLKEEQAAEARMAVSQELLTLNPSHWQARKALQEAKREQEEGKRREEERRKEQERKRKQAKRRRAGVLCLVGLVVLFGWFWGREYLAEVSQDKRFKRFANGVVYDTKTGLEWYTGPDRDTNHYEAVKFANNLDVAGGGWRLPTIEELRGIYERDKKSGNANNRKLDPVFNIGGGYWVWSGELVGEDEKTSNDENSSFARYFFFYYGSGYRHSRSNSYYGRVFCVRSGRRG